MDTIEKPKICDIEYTAKELILLALLAKLDWLPPPIFLGGNRGDERRLSKLVEPCQVRGLQEFAAGITSAKAAVIRLGPRYLVVFGSIEPADAREWLYDWPTSVHNQGSVARRYSNDMQLLQQQITRAAVSRGWQHTFPHPYPIVCIGHGIGGALATLYALDLAVQGIPVDLHTFGAPRVGDQTFANAFQLYSTRDVVKVFRPGSDRAGDKVDPLEPSLVTRMDRPLILHCAYVNGRDFVPYCPISGYSSCGGLVHIGGASRHDAGQSIQDALSGDPGPLDDHSIDAYLATFEAILERCSDSKRGPVIVVQPEVWQEASGANQPV